MEARVRNRSFVTNNGNPVVVWNVRSVESSNGLVGHGRTVRTFAQVCDQEVEVETGCSFRAESAVRAAGF